MDSLWKNMLYIFFLPKNSFSLCLSDILVNVINGLMIQCSNSLKDYSNTRWMLFLLKYFRFCERQTHTNKIMDNYSFLSISKSKVNASSSTFFSYIIYRKLWKIILGPIFERYYMYIYGISFLKFLFPYLNSDQKDLRGIHKNWNSFAITSFIRSPNEASIIFEIFMSPYQQWNSYQFFIPQLFFYTILTFHTINIIIQMFDLYIYWNLCTIQILIMYNNNNRIHHILQSFFRENKNIIFKMLLFSWFGNVWSQEFLRVDLSKTKHKKSEVFQKFQLIINNINKFFKTELTNFRIS